VRSSGFEPPRYCYHQPLKLAFLGFAPVVFSNLRRRKRAWCPSSARAGARPFRNIVTFRAFIYFDVTPLFVIPKLYARTCVFLSALLGFSHT